MNILKKKQEHGNRKKIMVIKQKIKKILQIIFLIKV